MTTHTSTTPPAPTETDAGALGPQDWRDVVTPPPGLAAQAAALVPGSDVLSTEELAAVALAIAERADLWQPLTVRDERRRRYRLLYEDHRIDIWVLSWMPGQGTGFHDHDESGVGLTVAQGMVVERQMLLPVGATRLELVPGTARQGPAGYIHSAAWGSGDPAVSIHAYSPPLVRVGQYRVGPDGILERRVEHGRRELMDQTIATIDPSRADG